MEDGGLDSQIEAILERSSEDSYEISRGSIFVKE